MEKNKHAAEEWDSVLTVFNEAQDIGWNIVSDKHVFFLLKKIIFKGPESLTKVLNKQITGLLMAPHLESRYLECGSEFTRT